MKYSYIYKLLLSVTLLLATKQVAADGSKDLYPSTLTLGHRAYLMATNTTPFPSSWPFPNYAEHFVYVKNGETIAAAFSARTGSGTLGTIRLTGPNGHVVTYPITSSATYNGKIIGRIANRAEELAGPGVTGGYSPYNYQIDGSANRQAGIWRVEFISSRGENYNVDDVVPITPTNTDWANNELNPRAFIAAWDISVRNTDVDGTSESHWKTGRVWANVLNFKMPALTDAVSFHGQHKVLTNDGIAYNVTHKGANGVGFTFLVNNSGFKASDDTKLYKSLNSSPPTEEQLHDPRKLDTQVDITHKIFYNKPHSDLPLTATMWQPDNLTGARTPGKAVQMWIKKPAENPEMTNFSFEGVEGTAGQAGIKGGKITFNSNVSGLYKITIPLPAPGKDRVLIGSCVNGTNAVFWDGKDGNGNHVPPGYTLSQASTQLFSAEIHFPFIDMEINPSGFTIEQLDANFNPDLSNTQRFQVFWDDSAIGNSAGASSPLVNGNSGTGVNSSLNTNSDNGHRYGSTSIAYGDNKSIDTWTYVPGAQSTENFTPIVIRSADLEVVNIVNTSGIVLGSVGQTHTYVVSIKNNGPDATIGMQPAIFQFYVPRGISIDPNEVTFGSEFGGASLPLAGVKSFDPITRILKVAVELPFNSSTASGGAFTIPVTIVGAIPTSKINVYATIMRPYDISDPDATNFDLNILYPRDPFEEATLESYTPSEENQFTPLRTQPVTGSTNNIKFNNEIEVIADVKVTKTVSPSTGHTIGSEVVFSIKAENLGGSTATNTIVNDLLTNRFAYISHSAPAGTSYDQNTGIWTIGTINALQNIEPLTIRATINSSGAAPANTATISASEFDPNVENNTSTVDLSLPTSAIQADLAIVKTGYRTATNSGTATFTLTVSNTNPSYPNDAVNVVVTDQLTNKYNSPSNYSLSHGSVQFSGTANRLIKWTIPYLAFGETATIVFTSDNLNTGTAVNVATVTANTPDPESANNSSSITPTGNSTAVNFSITKDVNNLTPSIGDEVEFTLTLTRLSGSNATTISVTDLIPSGYTFVSSNRPTLDATHGIYSATTGLWTFTSTINDGTTRTLKITARVDAPTNSPTEYLNTAVIIMNRVDSDPSDNIAHASIAIPTPKKSLFITNPMIYQRLIKN